MKPAALLLLLAVAASQVDLNLSETTDISSCPISFYGRSYTFLDVTINSSISMCFKNNQSDTAQDCLKLEDGGGMKDVSVAPVSGPTDVKVPPHIDSISTCRIYIGYQLGSSFPLEVFFYNLGTQTAVSVRSYTAYTPDVNLIATVDNSSVGSWSFTNDETFNKVFFDVSRCRVSDVLFLAGSDIATSPETCSEVSCDAYAAVRTVSTCGPTEVCQGNNTCIRPHDVCTVTGSTVIDFHGRVQSVEDRCEYNLMMSNPSFSLTAGFRERRRKDVSFLDHLTISLPGPLVDDRYLTLNATAQLFYGVELSKDHTGVTAKLPSSNMAVFFDGNTAHVSGPAEPLEGLCGNPINPSITTTLPREKSPYSAVGCEIQHNDTVDSTIDCNRSTEHCNLTRKAPFAACHDIIDPEPYITACTNTLCNYPSVDGLNCQFLEAYAKACNLKRVGIPEDWRSTAGCPADPKACQDQYCSYHEFCGEKPGGTRCFCRALFASKYKPRSALGEPTVCMQSSATVTLAGCLMEDKGIDYSTLHLKDPNCKGHMDDQTHMVTFSYNSSNICGTEVMTNNSQILFKNAIVMRNRSMDIITRNDQIEIDFSCFYTKPDIRSVSFTIKDSSVVQQIVSGVWNYTLMMNAYTDSGRMQLVVPSTEIQLNQKLWLELKTEGLDGNMVAIVTDSCWVTSQPSPDSSLRYDLVIKGCPNPADQTVTMERNGQGTSNVFSFNVFQFSGETSELYLHCQIELCPTQGQSCAPSCGGARRRKRSSTRSDYAGGNPALITMAWSK
ncbi:pancreatic secretory granule membrane major glycoprotein GP2-like [Sebastes fasciatus]|uniref:pancreatic secretory granule membrane major glycoprotein GP2-like n=1 Tax=Sebastes fasciatus TaxID=394691 RepID=UPI003D9E99B0